ncbi:hypothetical protein P9112_002129 [Eukaryota sp. TZLM1-RC]
MNNIIGPYITVKTIGKGSFGTCLLVKHIQTDQHYILKQIKLNNAPSDKEKEATLKEANLLRALEHPYIVRFIDSFVHEETNSLCIVMAYCQKGDLYKFLKARKGKHLAEDQILDWFIQLCLALQHCHSRHVLHRDIKTQNVFLTANNAVRLGDFGIAKQLGATMDVAKSIVGSPMYMSPEILDNRPYNSKSDVWSLGCVLYEMTTLKHAFDASNMNGLVFKIIRGRYPPIPLQYSSDLSNLIKQMLCKDPKQRPAIKQILKYSFIKNRIEHQLATSSDQVLSNQKQLGIVGTPATPKTEKTKRDRLLEEARRHKSDAEKVLNQVNERRSRHRGGEKKGDGRYKIMWAAGAMPGMMRQVKVPVGANPRPDRRKEKEEGDLESIVQDNRSKHEDLNKKLREMHEAWEARQQQRDQNRNRWAMGMESPYEEKRGAGTSIARKPSIEDLERIRNEERAKEEEKRRRNRERELEEIKRLEHLQYEDSKSDEDGSVVSEVEEHANDLLRQSISVINSLQDVVFSDFSEDDSIADDVRMSLLKDALNPVDNDQVTEDEDDDIVDTNAQDSFQVHEAQNGLLVKLSGLRQRAEKELGSAEFDRLYLSARNLVDDSDVDNRYCDAEKLIVEEVGYERRLEARLLVEVVALEDCLYASD